MPLTQEVKADLIKTHRVHETDTGSSDAQIAILTQRIKDLTDHFGRHKKDNNSKRGLLKLVGRRRRLMRYLARTNVERYRSLIGKLGIRG